MKNKLPGFITFAVLSLFMTSFSYTKASIPGPDYISFNEFCKTAHYQIKYNISLGYVNVNRDTNSLKLYLSMPYLVYSGNIYYLKNQPRLKNNGDLEIPGETALQITRLLGKTFPPASSSKASSQASEIFVSLKSSSSSESSRTSVTSKPQSSPASSSLPHSSSRKPESSSSHSSATVVNIPEKDNFKPIDTIVIDPGHGGKDPGGLGLNGIKEKELVLTLSKMVNELLKKESNVKVYFTRKEDRYVTLKERTDRTTSLLKKNTNPIFVSIHGNISLNRNTAGIEIYSLSDKASDEEAYSVEMAENAGFSKSDVEKTEALSSLINDLLKDGIRRESEYLAKSIGETLPEAAGAELKGTKKANFYVLKYNSIPSVLIEVGFMSNPKESQKLLDKSYQRKIAQGIYEGIHNFLENYNRTRGFTK